jgi:type III restriction enzyme
LFTPGTHGRWAFAELGDVYQIGTEFGAEVERNVDAMISSASDRVGEVAAATVS